MTWDAGLLLTGLPLCLATRAANIFPLSRVANKYRKLPLPLNLQVRPSRSRALPISIASCPCPLTCRCGAAAGLQTITSQVSRLHQLGCSHGHNECLYHTAAAVA